MRDYEYGNKWQKLLTPEIVSMLTQIHEYKGEQTLFIPASNEPSRRACTDICITTSGE